MAVTVFMPPLFAIVVPARIDGFAGVYRAAAGAHL
jgi:hypothetical protein